MSESPAIAGLNLLGGRLCLDFVNTTEGGHDPPTRDWWTSYADLVAWGHHAGALDAAEVAPLLAAATQQPAAAAAVLAAARRLRTALYGLFQAAVTGDSPPLAALTTLNAALAAAESHACLVPAAGGFAWDWPPGAQLDRVLWPVARSAADLLTTPDLARVRECAGDSCAWLFVDTSRNGSRRWCDMQDCGNRAKARRHYQRHAGSRIMPKD